MNHALRLDTSLEHLRERLEALTEPCALATIIGTEGSTYRKAGARMLIEANGRLTGLLSGGCFEQDLREHAARMLASGVPKIVSYDMRGDDDLVFGLGAGCEGAMKILIEPISPGSYAADSVRLATDRLALGESAVLAVVHAGSPRELGTHYGSPERGHLLDASLLAACDSANSRGSSGVVRWQARGQDFEAWVQYLAPAPRVLLCGAGPDVEPVVALGRTLRFPVMVVDHRPAYAIAERFPGAVVSLGSAATLAERVSLDQFFAAIVMSHHLPSDAEYLKALAASAIPHIGLLGPRPRRDRLLQDIGASAADALAHRLHGPVGLDIGAAMPESIALSIMAEIHALAAGGSRVQAIRACRLPRQSD